MPRERTELLILPFANMPRVTQYPHITRQVLDDGYEKQDMVKWREAEVVTNTAASADDRESEE